MTLPNALTLDWNQVVIVAKHQDQVHVFAAWKRELASWLSPARWTDPTTWPDTESLVRHAPGTPWAPQAYGVVVFDFDTRQVWSFNDYQVPGKGFLLDNHPEAKPLSHYRNPRWKLPKDPLERDLQGAAWAALLRCPEAWDDVQLTGVQRPGWVQTLLRSNIATERTWTLREHLAALPKDATPAAQDALLMSTRGEVHHQDQQLIVLGVRYRPPGWTVHQDHHFDGRLNGWLSLLEQVQAWPGLDEAGWCESLLEACSDYVTLEHRPTTFSTLAQTLDTMAAQALAEDPDFSEEAQELQEVARRLMAVAAARPNPARPTPR